jgi:hypothetical protein
MPLTKKQKAINLGNRRLLRLRSILLKADALHRRRKEPGYAQSTFRHECGAPACALGHWAAANPRRWRWRDIGVSISNPAPLLRSKRIRHPVDPCGLVTQVFASAMKEFALTDEQAEEIFGGYGCGQGPHSLTSITARDAADYIGDFVKCRKAAAKRKA